MRTVPLALGDGGIDWTILESVVGDRTRLVILNTPSNPLGKVWTRDELDRFAGIVAGTRAVVVTDEIYEDLLYDGRIHVPPATHPDLFARTVTISGVSKAFSVTGWRLGWLCAPPDLAQSIGPVFDVMCVCAPRPLQQGAAVALRDLPESYYTNMRDGYERRRSILQSALETAGFQVQVPEGSYYMMADYTERYGELEPLEACFRLLDEVRVAAIPSTIFYAGESPPQLRFQFAVEDDILEEVARRMRG